MNRRQLMFNPSTGLGEMPYFNGEEFYRLIARTPDGTGECAYPGQATAGEAWAMRETPRVLADAVEKGYTTFFVHSYRPVLLIEDVTPS